MHPFNYGMWNSQGPILPFMPRLGVSDNQHTGFMVEKTSYCIRAEAPHFGDLFNAVVAFIESGRHEWMPDGRWGVSFPHRLRLSSKLLPFLIRPPALQKSWRANSGTRGVKYFRSVSSANQRFAELVSS